MGSVQELKLLGEKLGPYVSRVMMSLSLKGINYEFFPEDLQNKSELLLKSNPVYKKCPVLIHNGKPISESLVILEYIEETWPGSPHPLLPSDPYDRALARFWADFIDNKLAHSMMEILKTSDKEAQVKWAEEAKANAVFLEDAFKSLRKGKTYFGGEKPGLVDLVFVSFYANLKAIETLREVSLINGEATPALNALLEALQGNEGVKDLVPDQVRVTEIFRNFIHSQRQA